MTKKWMNRDLIKYIAMVVMALNHISTIFLEPGTWTGELLLDVGYFTAPVMCYFLVEGYGYTRSTGAYGRRLFLFALISEIPFCLAFTREGLISFVAMNMMFTLFLCFLIIRVMREMINPAGRSLCIAGLIALSLFSDWPILAPVFTILFVQAGEDEAKKKKAFVTGTLVFGAITFLGNGGRFSLMKNLVCTLGSMAGPALAGVCILRLYNGKRSDRHRGFSKWFFYWFYPAHLTILGLIRVFS